MNEAYKNLVERRSVRKYNNKNVARCTAPGHYLYKLFVIFGRSPAIIKDLSLIQSPSSFLCMILL